MCGITGIFDLRGHRDISADVLHRMNESQFHRGPDEGSVHLAPGIGLGHRRLSIIDIATGQQPMFSADGQIVVVFNGQIFNFLDVRRELEDFGYRFKTRCDTEVILNAWAEWGEACVNHFRGFFAFALHDRRNDTFFLARDRLGVKPLHYAETSDGYLLFGSELKSILQHPAVRRTIDPRAVDGFFTYGYVPDPLTIFSTVKKMPAAHTMVVRRGQTTLTPKAYWDVSFAHRHKGSEAELAEELTRRVRECVKIRLTSEVPLGAFLSGGVDSSAVVAMMAEAGGEAVNTCSIGFDVPDFDESAYADQMARRYKTKHRSRKVLVDDFSLIDTLVAAYDEPFADSSALPTYRVCELARETVTVALSGDGGDELFAGYSRYQYHANEEKVRSMLPFGVRKPLFGFLGQVYPKMDWAPKMFRARTTFQALSLSTAEAYVHSVSQMRSETRHALMSDKFRSALQGYDAVSHMADIMTNAPAEDAVAQAQYADLKVWLPGDILTKVDRASMAVSLEAREPLLDHTLLEWASGLPTEMRLRGGTGKYLLKKAMEPYIPNDLLYRPKQGFSMPISNWFRGPLFDTIDAIGKNSPLLDTGWFNAKFLQTAAQEHRRGLRDYGTMFWQLLMFDRSIRKLCGEQAPAFSQ
jgi:asparagine synthase (glutamine-hydrolysing)